MTAENINNLTGLWKLALGSLLKTSGHSKMYFGWINNSQWPNRIWIDGIPNKEILYKVHDIMKSAPLPLTFSHFHTQGTHQYTSIVEHMFKKKSVQYGMHLRLTKKYDIKEHLSFKKVETYQDARLWSGVFYKSFQYIIESATVYNTMKTIAYFIVYSKKKAIGTVAFYLHAGVAGVHLLGIIPEERGKGYAKVVTQFVLNQAFDKKMDKITLQASEMAHKLYRDLRFSTEFLLQNYQLK